jgi:hypothetical protein
VKEAAEKTKPVESRALRDQWYPVKVDNACRTVVLRAVAKEYYDAIRKQQRLHQDEFLAEDTNIWKATCYLKPGEGSR